jgi:hypothetical protein
MHRFIRCRGGRVVLWRWQFALLSLPIIIVLSPTGIHGQQRSSSKFELRTSSFTPGGPIPKEFTCDAGDRSPAISWTDPPSGTQSFAIIEDDPDALSGTFVHWVVYDLPAAFRWLPEALSGDESVLGWGRQGINSFERAGYNGPCPPPGKPHRYFIRLYALDVKLNLRPGAPRKELEAAMKGHILARAELMGRYGR